MVAGMFHITSLQHSLSIFSTTLQPVSDNRGAQSHPVFAPVSHPLPVISTATTSESMGQLSSPILSRLALPSSFRLRDSGVGLHRIVFLIREHRSGLEGIRAGVVPGFSHIWLEERGPWGLRGVHPVSGYFTFKRSQADVCH